MREVKTRAAVEHPKMREKSAMPRAAVRILQRRYAQERRERKPEEYATEQVQQGTADVAQMAQESLRRILPLRSRMYRRQRSVKDLYTAAPLL